VPAFVRAPKSARRAMPGKDESKMKGLEEDDDLAELESDFAAPFQRGTWSGANQIPPAAQLADDEVIW